MACETIRKPKQTLAERIAEITKAIALLDAKLKKKMVRPVVGPQGAITFEGWTDPAERNGVTDACAYRRLMATGSVLAKAAIASAEFRAGRSVDRQAIATGVHSHDGGHTWHGHKG